jgi:multiple sugar transport system substrate-binding protein
MFADLLLACLALLSIGSASAATGTLVINSNSTDPAPRAAWQAAVDRFALENPDLTVELNVYDHESYKKAIRNWLTGMPPDVMQRQLIAGLAYAGGER